MTIAPDAPLDLPAMATEPDAVADPGPDGATAQVAAVHEQRDRRLSRDERLADERQRLVDSVSAGRTDRLLERVAWVLSRFPETRDSDVALQLRYWKEYEPEMFDQLDIDPKVLFRLTRLTSIARARARIQNTHRLFVASEAVRRRRGALSEEERERLANPTPADPLLTVYADESGKTQDYLVVGSLWFLDPSDTIGVYNRVEAWRRERRFDGELHFTNISPRTLPLYMEVVDVALGSVAGVSFKSVTVPRVGIASVADAIDQLFFELLRLGVDHEHRTGRAPLPRRLSVYKDLEEAGRDALLMNRLRTALTTASATELGGALSVEVLEAVRSDDQPLMQLADLYTASVSRTLQRSAPSDRPKDRFADFLLERARGPGHVEGTEQIADMEVHVRL